MAIDQEPLSPIENKIGLPTVWLERFLVKINKNGPNGCWIWTAFVNESGYGQFKWGDQGAAPWKAHRLSYALTHGLIPDGMHLHHECRNPVCVNPSHLRLVTPREHVVELTPSSPSAICAAKTHCKNGHEFTPENTRYTGNGKRVCITCNRAWHNAKYARFREQNPLPEKTHCIKGHPLSGDNLVPYKTKTGTGRGCRICRLEITKSYLKRNRQMAHAKERVREKIKQGKSNFSEIELKALEQLRGNSKYVPA